ncbi:hypothetical protein [Bacillus thuringiensis]|uniref:hypothetical protein n=1 Tax=Bacillus thuringiensis TaxID=1428 RepID=UPI000BFE96C3|nr:hypothetical protein [Bacillus thuringiensis]PGT90101.1 hypothetical protein COD17_10145 [Bacillus thuringiensis]
MASKLRSLYVAGDISAEEVIGSLIMQEEHEAYVIESTEADGFVYKPLGEDAETSLTEYGQEVVDNYKQGKSVAIIGGSASEVSAFIKELLKNPVTKAEGLVVVCGYNDNMFSDTLSQISKLEEDLANMQFIVGICEDDEDMKDFVMWHRGGKPYYDITKITELFPYLHTTLHIRNGQCVPWLEKEDTEEAEEEEETEQAGYTIPVHTIDPSFLKVDMHKLKEKFRKGKCFVIMGGEVEQQISLVSHLQKEGTILGQYADLKYVDGGVNQSETVAFDTVEELEEQLELLALSAYIPLVKVKKGVRVVSLLDADVNYLHKLAVHWDATKTNGCVTIARGNAEEILQYIQKMDYRTLEIVKIEEDK